MCPLYRGALYTVVCPLYRGVLYTEVSLYTEVPFIQRYRCVLYTEVPFIQRCPLYRVALCPL